MSDLFSIYEDTYHKVIEKIQKIIDSMNNLSKEKTEQALSEANDNLIEAERYLKQMELECDANFGKNSDRLKIKIRNYKNEYETVKRRFLKLQEQYIDRKSRDYLNDSTRKSIHQQRLIEAEEISYNNSNLALDKGIRASHIIEKSAIEVIKDLNNNTNKMKSTDARVLGLMNNIDENADIIEEMNRREARTKYIILATALILFSILVIVIGVRLFVNEDNIGNSTVKH